LSLAVQFDGLADVITEHIFINIAGLFEFQVFLIPNRRRRANRIYLRKPHRAEKPGRLFPDGTDDRQHIIPFISRHTIDDYFLASGAISSTVSRSSEIILTCSGCTRLFSISSAVNLFMA